MEDCTPECSCTFNITCQEFIDKGQLSDFMEANNYSKRLAEKGRGLCPYHIGICSVHQKIPEFIQ